MSGMNLEAEAPALVSVPTGPPTLRWRAVPIDEIDSGDRRVDNNHVARLVDSFRRLGGQLQLQPPGGCPKGRLESRVGSRTARSFT